MGFAFVIDILGDGADSLAKLKILRVLRVLRSFKAFSTIITTFYQVSTSSHQRVRN